MEKNEKKSSLKKNIFQRTENIKTKYGCYLKEKLNQITEKILQ